MKIRQKSYLLSTVLVSAVLFLCTFFLILPTFRAALSGAEARALGEEKALALAIDRLIESTPEEMRRSVVRGFFLYDSGDAAFAVGSGPETWFSTDPEPPVGVSGTSVWVARDGRSFLTVEDELSDGVWLRYALDATETVRRSERQMIGAVILCTALCCGIAAALYGLLMRINRPVERLAHELRTPLTVIRGYGEMLERAKLTPEQQHRAAGYIVAESERLGEISEKLLTLADARANAYTPERIRVEELAAHLRETYPSLESEIEWETLTGDRALLLSLFGNLIGNAVEASAPGAPVKFYAAPGRVEIADTGKGMSAEQLRYVNDPAHAKNPSVRSGLGVPLCHEIAALHHATLRFVSKEGEGTTATVEFTRL